MCSGWAVDGPVDNGLDGHGLALENTPDVKYLLYPQKTRGGAHVGPVLPRSRPKT
jgi:hypothetical protein